MPSGQISQDGLYNTTPIELVEEIDKRAHKQTKQKRQQVNAVYGIMSKTQRKETPDLTEGSDVVDQTASEDHSSCFRQRKWWILAATAVVITVAVTLAVVFGSNDKIRGSWEDILDIQAKYELSGLTVGKVELRNNGRRLFLFPFVSSGDSQAVIVYDQNQTDQRWYLHSAIPRPGQVRTEAGDLISGFWRDATSSSNG